MTWLSISIDRLFLDAGCGIIVISSFILSGFNKESPLVILPLLLPLAVEFFLLSIAFLATVLCAEYTWFSNCLYMPKVAVHTVHLYDKCAGFRVILCSRDTWFNSFHRYIWREEKINVRHVIFMFSNTKIKMIITGYLLFRTLDSDQHPCLC